MKVLLTYIGPESAIKVDFPIIPDYDSKILLSGSDYQKVFKTLIDQFRFVEIHATKQEREMAVKLYIENALVLNIDIAWDEEEQAYLPLITMSQPMSEDFDDDMDEDFNGNFTDLNDVDEKPHHKAHTHGKKKKLFN